jgi:hypothetical protein
LTAAEFAMVTVSQHTEIEDQLGLELYTVTARKLSLSRQQEMNRSRITKVLKD